MVVVGPLPCDNSGHTPSIESIQKPHMNSGHPPCLSEVKGEQAEPTWSNFLPAHMDGSSMRLEEYWGVGPKTSTQLETTLGTEGAITAIESMDIAALVDAGLPRGRATRILRHSHGEHGMAMLATSDTRAVYKDLLERACEYAITEHARDRIRVLTPLTSTDAMEDRFDDVTLATETWTDLDDPTHEAVLDVFAHFEETGGGERAAVETVRELQEAGVSTGVFDRIDAIDTDALEDAAEALGSLNIDGDGTDGQTVGEGVNDELDTLGD